jgi:aminoglycoside phosphotransferase (APT) family kinase protein
LLKYFARSFSIIASKERTPQCFLEQLTARVLQERSRQSSGDWSGGIRHILISTGKVTVVVGGCKGHANDLESGLLIKIPLTPDGQLALERNFRTLESIGEDTRRFKAVAAYVPRSFGRGEFLGQPYFVEESIPGVAGETVRLNGSAKSNIMKTAGDLLTKLHLATQSWSVIDVSIFERRFAKAIREVAYFLGYENQRGVLEQLTSNLGKMVLGARLPLIWCHGDFSLKNVLVSSSKISGLIGWELAETRALPLLDMLHLLLRDRIVEEKLSMRGVISKYLVPLNLTSGGDLLSDYIEALSIDRSLILPLSIMYWVNRIHGHIGSLNDLDADWVNENFVQVINDLNREL